MAAALVVLASAVPARAQERGPIPVAVFEIRGVTGGLPADPATREDLGLSELPRRAFGGVAGLQFFPVRRLGFAVGVGGEGLWARTGADIVDTAGALTGDRVVRHLQGLAGIVSLNFGHDGGWSHISGGLGPLTFRDSLSPRPEPSPTQNVLSPYAWTLNAGGGARWFLSRHAGVGFDIRVYFTRAAAETPESAGRQAQRLVLMSMGVTIK